MADDLDRRPIRQGRVWSGAARGAGVCLYRLRVEVDRPVARAVLLLHAEDRYGLWVDGRWVGRGPVLHHPTRPALDAYDLTDAWAPGPHVLAVRVVFDDTPQHNHVTTGEPGLTAELRCEPGDGGEPWTIGMDGRWRVWRLDDDPVVRSPRRNWALGRMEWRDLRAEPGDEAGGAGGAGWDEGWMRVGFDDSGWACGMPTHEPAWSGFGVLRAPSTPGLRYGEVVGRLVRARAWRGEVTPLEIGTSLPELVCALDAGVTGEVVGGGDVVRGSAVYDFDLGSNLAGQRWCEVEAGSEGVLYVGWSECLDERGEVELVRKGTAYVDRYDVPAGRSRIQSMGLSAGRYLRVCALGFDKGVRVERAGMLASEPVLAWDGGFSCGDDRLNGLFELCVNTLRVGTQEGLMDCPTREQAPYLGDAHPVARWIAVLTGDTRWWRHTVVEQFARPGRDGMIRSAIFSGASDVLLDYPLLGVWWTAAYGRFTGDVETLRGVLEPLRGVMDWYDRRRTHEGLLDWQWSGSPERTGWEHPAGRGRPEMTDYNLFIDHPGLGWHNVGEPGIDRRGVNTALHALWAVALRATAWIERAVGNQREASQRWRQARALTATIRRRMVDPVRRCFVDGEFEGRRLEAASMQTQAWALMAGGADTPGLRRGALERMMRPPTDAAQAGPYFWQYVLPHAAQAGELGWALSRVMKLWAPMLEGGTGTVWETFAGDALDSLCHPWSAAPIDLCLHGLLGLPGAMRQGGMVHLRPAVGLLAEAEGRMAMPAGPVRIGWQRGGNDDLSIEGELPEGIEGVLHLPGEEATRVRGQWGVRTPVQTI